MPECPFQIKISNTWSDTNDLFFGVSILVRINTLTTILFHSDHCICCFFQMATHWLELPHHRAIQELFKYLVDNVSTRDVLDYIFEGGCLSLDDKEAVEKTTGERDKTRRLLDILLRKERGAFDQFLYALKETTNHVYITLSQKVEDIQQRNKSKHMQEKVYIFSCSELGFSWNMLWSHLALSLYIWPLGQ